MCMNLIKQNMAEKTEISTLENTQEDFYNFLQFDKRQTVLVF